MAQTVYTSARDVDVRTCAPQPLLRSNYFAEFRTEADKAKARRNLGINEENDLFWGNIQGFIELQKDLIDYLQKDLMEYAKDNVPYTNTTQEDVSTVKEALDFVFQTIVDYGKHKEDYIKLNTAVDELTNNFNQLQEHVTQIEDSFTQAIQEKGQAIEELINNLDTFKNEVSQFQQSISENVGTLSESVQDISERITNIENTFDGSLKYNSSLNDAVTAPNKIGGINAGTTVGSLRDKSLIDIIDILVFPANVPTLRQPSLSYNYNSPQLIKVGTSLTPSLSFYAGDSGGQDGDITEVITYNDIKIDDFQGFTQLGTYKYIGTVNYLAGEYLVDDRGNQTNQRVEAGSKSTTLIINTTYPWFINGEEQRLIPFNQNSGEILFTQKKPEIKLPGANSKINTFTFDGGSGYLEVNLAETVWDITEEDINGIPYKVWTKKEEYVDALPHKINFILLE